MQQACVESVLPPTRHHHVDHCTKEMNYITINSLSEIKSVLNEQQEQSSLILFDLDNTLMETAQTLGTDQWFDKQYEQRVQCGETAAQALGNILPLYHEVQRVTSVNIIEESTPNVINELRIQGHMVIGFTARGHVLEEATRQQLKSIGINFAVAFDHKHHIQLLEESDLFFDRGVVYCGGQNKGFCLPHVLTYLRNEFSQIPDSMLFIDDKIKNVQAVVKKAQELNLQCTGFHFTRLANKLSVDASIVAEQEKTFKRKVLSNEDAKILVDSKRREIEYPGLQLLCHAAAKP